MFKATLIEDSKYFNLKQKETILFLSLTLIGAVITNLHSVPFLYIFLVFSVIAILAYFQFKIMKEIQKIKGKTFLEIDENKIRVITKSGVVKEIYEVKKIVKIGLKEKYQVPPDTINEVTKQLKGVFNQNELIIYTKDDNRTLKFEIESYYMQEQINKIKNIWINNHINIITI